MHICTNDDALYRIFYPFRKLFRILAIVGLAWAVIGSALHTNKTYHSLQSRPQHVYARSTARN